MSQPFFHRSQGGHTSFVKNDIYTLYIHISGPSIEIVSKEKYKKQRIDLTIHKMEVRAGQESVLGLDLSLLSMDLLPVHTFNC